MVADSIDRDSITKAVDSLVGSLQWITAGGDVPLVSQWKFV